MARTKGTGLIEIVKFLRTQRTRASEILPPGLHRYLDERILVGSWYPEQDVMRLLKAVVQLIGAPDGYEKSGVLLARKNLATVYAHVVRPGQGVPAVLTYISALWSNYHDTGTETATFSANSCRIEVKDFAVCSAEYCRLIGAYNGELIERAGGKLSATRKLYCTANGDPSCVWEYDWVPV